MTLELMLNKSITKNILELNTFELKKEMIPINAIEAMTSEKNKKNTFSRFLIFII